MWAFLPKASAMKWPEVWNNCCGHALELILCVVLFLVRLLEIDLKSKHSVLKWTTLNCSLCSLFQRAVVHYLNIPFEVSCLRTSKKIMYVEKDDVIRYLLYFKSDVRLHGRLFIRWMFYICCLNNLKCIIKYFMFIISFLFSN